MREHAGLIGLLLLALAGGCASGGSKACSPRPDGTDRPVLTAPQRSTIFLDGVLSDWQGIAFTRVTPTSGVFDKGTKAAADEADLSFRFAVCHDREALYVAVEVIDDVIHADSCAPGSISCPAWDDDAIEVFIDGNHNHAENSRANNRADLKFGGEFALVANGAANSDYSGYPNTFGKVETWQGAVKRVEPHNPIVRYEFRITWSMMGLNAPPDRLGFSISAQDDDDGGGREHALYFVGNPTAPFVDERYFADVVLAK